MRLPRMMLSMIGATIIVVAMLVVGLRYFNPPQEPGARELRAFRIEYLTPEEAAELLGEDVSRFAQPERITLPPDAGADPD